MLPCVSLLVSEYILKCILIYFNNQKFDTNSNPPDREEIKSALKSFNNGKTFGTNKIPTEAFKYGIFFESTNHGNLNVTEYYLDDNDDSL